MPKPAAPLNNQDVIRLVQAKVGDDLIITKIGNHEQMYDYWVGQHVCPWYQTFDEALAANPFPLPFNGTNWPALDCTFAP